MATRRGHSILLLLVWTTTLALAVAGDYWLFDGCPDTQRIAALPFDGRTQVVIADSYWPIAWAILAAQALWGVGLWNRRRGGR